MPAYLPDALSVLLHPALSHNQTRQKLKRSTVLAAALASGLLVPVMAQGQALPTGGQVVAGAAQIAGMGPNLTISQTSDKAVIDWSSFSVGQGNAVQFNNGNGATLNRVTGGNLSSIDGLLSATGSVYLINPNGVIIGKSGVVKVGGGFTASTLDIGNANFLNGGDLTLEGPSLASVVNLGQIGALGGDVALVAANVRNDGTVNAPNGALGLLAGNRILMRDATINDGKFLVLSGGAATSATNTGSIDAATAELRAEGGNVYALAGNTQGLIRATGVSTHEGRIFLSANAVEVSGSTLSATNNGEGGSIALTGQTISVASDATLDASGANSGGRVTAIADMASGTLNFHGTALAKGSQTGGFVETSGHRVDFSGARIDTSGAQSGNWLVDPDDLTVDASAASTIQTNLASTNVTLRTTSTTASGPGNSTSGSGDIVVNSDISWSSANTLTLDSYHSIQVNANLTASGAGGVVLTTNHGGSGGDYYFAYGKSLSFTGSGGSLNINGNVYTLLRSMADFSGMENSIGNYALARSVDASGTTYSEIVHDYSNNATHLGTFTGLGNTVNNLTIARGGSYGGLFAFNYGTVRDIGVVGGSISVGDTAGGLVGFNYGIIANAWTNNTVNAGVEAGGLVGVNSNTIRNSFSMGTVNGDSGLGGLVGYNQSGKTIADSFSTATVNGNITYIGGLVGSSDGNVSNSFAAGLVVGGGAEGGLIGSNSGSVTNSYYNSSTTGESDTGKGTGQTTAQLQGTLPSGFSTSVWGTDTGLYPYLKSFFPNGPQVVKGTAYDSSFGAAARASLGLYTGGSQLAGATAGANGYYYLIFAPGTITGSTKLGLTETLSGGASPAGAIYTNAPSLSSGNLANFNITANNFSYNTAATSFSALKTDAASTFGSSLYTSLLSGPGAATDYIFASGAFTLDAPLGNSGSVLLRAYGDMNINSDITLSGTSGLMLDVQNNLYINANIVASGANDVGIGTGGDYNIMPGKSLTFTNTPGGGQTLNINGQTYQLLYTLSDLLSIDGGSSYYAMAHSIDASGTTFTNRPINTMDGNLTGLGHTIANLNINAPGDDYVGLIGTNTGYVRDIGITSGTVYGNYYTGALVAENYGQIYNTYAGVDMHVVYRSGGLVGVNYGLISRSHATGSVTSNGANGVVSDMGGLVGWNDTAGTVNESYATGTVTGTANTTAGLVAFNLGTINDSFATGGVFGNLYAGGLVGYAAGNISNSYATGYVHATSKGGGFAGYFIGTLTNSYWDTTTSGTSVGIADGVSTGTPTGLTRSTLQNGSLPTGFSSAIWATGNGLYPYLKSQFQTGMQSISGTTLGNNGTALPAATVAVYVNGVQVGGTTAASGADGYYYLMAQPGTVISSTPIGITETDHGGSTVTGLAYTDAPTLTSGQVTGFDVQSGRATYTTGATTYSALQTAAATPFGSKYSAITTDLASADTYITTGNAFSFATSTSFGGGLSVTATGGITLNGGVNATGAVNFGSAVTLGTDSLVSGSNVNFGSTLDGAHSLSMISTGVTNFSGTVGGSSALSDLVITGGGTIVLNGNVTTSGSQSYYNAINLGTDVSLTGSVLRFDAAINGAHALNLTGTKLTLTGGMGGATALTSLTGQATSGNIAVGGAIHTTGAIFLAANGTFTNTAGASALSAGTGFTVYTQNAGDPTGTMPVNSFGGLTAGSYYNDAYNFTSGTFASAVPTGNHFVYAYAAKLTVTPDTKTLTYNGNIQSDSYGVTGYLGSDAASSTFTGSVTGLAATSKNAGDYTITASGTLASAQNYQIQYGSSGVLTIGKAGLTIAAGADSKTYDAGTTSTGTVTVTGLLGSDTVTGKTQAFDSKNAGSRTLSVTGYTVNDGNSGGNYTVTTQTASGTIAKAALIIAAGTDSKTYDAGTTSTGTVSVTGLKGSDTVTGKVQTFDSKNAGSRTLSVTGYTLNDGNNGSNYNVTTQAASGTIAKADLTIAAGTDSKTYDATTTSTGTVSVTGLKGSDTVTGKTQAFDSKNAGSRTLSVTGYTLTDGNNGGNYTVTTQTASGSIAKAALTIAAGTDSKTYDATTGSTGTVSVAGLKGSDTVTGKTQAFDSKNAGNRALTVTGYTVNDGNSGGNYAVTTQTASGSIAKAALTAGLTNSTTKTYDASLSATLTAGNYTLSGIKGSDTVTLNNPAFGSYADINVGTGKTVTASGLALSGVDAGNYTVNGTASANIGRITARPLTLTANNLGKFAGAVDPVLTYAITSGDLASSDSLTGGLARTTGENPGIYDINQGSLAASANYDVTFVKGPFTVTAVALQNNPVVNPVSGSVSSANQPTIKTAPIGLSNGPSDAGGSASDASGTSSTNRTPDAGSAAGGGNEEATGPTVQTAGQSSSTCATGESCANTPYPTNQYISSSISFTSK